VRPRNRAFPRRIPGMVRAMKLLTIVLCALPFALRAAPPVMEAAESPETFPASVGLQTLSVAPADFDLRGPGASGQLLVTAVFADGTSADVTRAAKVLLEGSAATCFCDRAGDAGGGGGRGATD
jgi:hypothetical protein